MEAKKLIEGILISGTPEEKRELFRFSRANSDRVILHKFKYFAAGLFPRFFKKPSAPWHDQYIMSLIGSYYGKNYLKAAFRGSAKTSLKKLFDTFVLLNDNESTRKYVKVLAKDGKNSKQIVTDVYNLMIEAREIYGDVFEKEGDKKREETMSSFTMKNGRKYSSGTVGQTQRGHVQDAYRPDWLWFEDVEDRESVRSMTVTQGIIEKCQEAIDGLAKDGSYVVTCNYISDQGTVQWFMNKPSVEVSITPILNEKGESTWPIFTLEDIDRIKQDADDYAGEYLCDPMKSTNRFFDLERVEAAILGSKKPIKESAGVMYWDNYRPNHRYGQGSDHSEGLGQDSNALVGWDFTSGEMVYRHVSAVLSPDLAAHEYARVGREFGNCLYAPEVNAKCGGIVITTLKSLNYPNIYRQFNEKKAKTVQTETLGWGTNSSTKYNMFYEFRTDWNDGLIKIYDIELLKEMKAYSNADLTESNVGLVTRHFDLLTAAVIGWQMRKYATVAREADRKSYARAYDAYLEALQ